VPEFRISIDIGEFLPPGGALTKDAFPSLSAMVQRMGLAIQETWKAYADGAPLPSGKVLHPQSGAYGRSILFRSTGDFSAEAYSELPYADVIERGSSGYDMKKMLDSSVKVRLTKDGRRYLIIPFRWNNPNAVTGNRMPAEVHRWWQEEERQRSQVIGTYRRLSGTGAFDIKTRERVTVPGWRYQWGDRLDKHALAHLGFGENDKVAKRLVGMVNFRRPEQKGGAQHSQYLTFRTMMEGSKGWIAPARPGLYPALSAGETIRPIAEKAFSAAVQEDVARILGIGADAP
jgi:hypothetical protein